jgi:hypothetical protein
MGSEGAGVDTPGYGSFGKAVEEGEIAPPPLSSLHITPPLLCDIVCRQVGTAVNERWSK